MLRRPYSRLAKTEEKKNTRQAIIFGILTLGALIILFIFGLPTVAKFAALLTDLNQSTQPIEKNDNTPPAPPKLNILPEAINKNSVEVSGTAEPGTTIKFSLNGNDEELLVDTNGNFILTFYLNLGENRISAKAIDAAGNESNETEKITILYDTEKPTLELISPDDGSNFYGAKQRQVVIEGQTESGISLTINDRLIVVEDDGTFAFTTTLSEGTNEFNVKAKDIAGNEVEQKLALNFSP